MRKIMEQVGTVAVLSLALACGGGQQQQMQMQAVCSPSSCGGCCNGDRCESGTSAAACGVDGATCSACGALTCVAGSCQMPMVPDSGTPRPKRIFITRNGYSGDLKTAGGGTDGLDGADKLCQRAADSVLLGGAWRAFLSTTTTSAIDRISDVGPWANMRDQRVFNNKAGFLTGPLAVIEYTERGDPTSYTSGTTTRGATVWTGSTQTGTPAMWQNFSGVDEPANCENWTFGGATNGSGEYHKGNTGVGDARSPAWMADSINPDESCSNQLPLYCFEQ